MKTFSGFTLVELLVSITIISLMAALSISSYPKFSEQISLSSEAYKMLAYMRETQTYGTSAISTPGTKFVYAFEVDKSAGTLKRYIWIGPTDKLNSSYLNLSGSKTVLDSTAPVFSLKNLYEVEKICTDTACAIQLDKGYAFFRRPNPEGRLIGLQGNNIEPDLNTGSYDRLEIYVRSKKNNGINKKIVILSTGQMYISDW